MSDQKYGILSPQLKMPKKWVLLFLIWIPVIANALQINCTGQREQETVTSDLIALRPAPPPKQAQILAQPELLLSTTDPHSHLWKECQVFPPDTAILNVLGLTLRILQNCHIYEEVPSQDGFPAMFLEVADKKSDSVGKHIDAGLFDTSIGDEEHGKFELGLAHLEASTKFRIINGSIDVDINILATAAQVNLEFQFLAIEARIAAGIEATISSTKLAFFARADADVTISAGPLDFNAGFSADSGVAIGTDGIEVKLLGTGFAFTEDKLEICIQICIALNFGFFKANDTAPVDIYAEPVMRNMSSPMELDRERNNANANSASKKKGPHADWETMRLIREWDAELRTRKKQPKFKPEDSEKIFARLTRVVKQARHDVEKISSKRSFASVCNSLDPVHVRICDEALDSLDHASVLNKKPLLTAKQFKPMKIKKGRKGKNM